MKQHVYKPSRRKNGKSVKSRLYSGRYRLHGDSSDTTVSLGVSDKQVAEKKLADIVRAEQRRRAKLDPSLEEVATASSPLEDVVQDWLGDLEAKGRTKTTSPPKASYSAS